VRYTVILMDEVKTRLRALPQALRSDIGHRLFLLEEDLGGDVKKIERFAESVPSASARSSSPFRTRRSGCDSVCCWQSKEHLPMSTAVLKPRSRAANVRGRVNIDKQIRRGKAVLRKLRATLEDLEDRRELVAAKKRNAGKPGTPLCQAAKELGF
jgi:hypothetical protein